MLVISGGYPYPSVPVAQMVVTAHIPVSREAREEAKAAKGVGRGGFRHGLTTTYSIAHLVKSLDADQPVEDHSI
jgi:hypothetical protein